MVCVLPYFLEAFGARYPFSNLTFTEFAVHFELWRCGLDALQKLIEMSLPYRKKDCPTFAEILTLVSLKNSPIL